MKRFGEMQLWPAFMKPAARRQARRPAAGRRRRARRTASEPPSSSTDFLIASPAAAPTAAAGPLAAGDGDGADARVGDQPPHDGGDVRLGDDERAEQPLGRTGLGEQIADAPARSR